MAESAMWCCCCAGILTLLQQAVCPGRTLTRAAQVSAVVPCWFTSIVNASMPAQVLFVLLMWFYVTAQNRRVELHQLGDRPVQRHLLMWVCGGRAATSTARRWVIDAVCQWIQQCDRKMSGWTLSLSVTYAR